MDETAGPEGAAPKPAVDGRDRSGRPRTLGCLIEIAETLVLTIVIFWLVQAFVAQPFEVQQESMLTTLEPGQYVLIDKLTPRVSPYQRGDIVVFNPLNRDGSCDVEADPYQGPLVPYIKRVIGLPGDSVQLREGAVYVNGQRLNEPYARDKATEPQSEVSTWLVAPDRLFVLGDNRGNSVDSRSEQIGEICPRDVVGRAFLRYWPIDAIGIIARPSYSAEGGVSTSLQ